MKAIIQTAYGSPGSFELRNVPKPQIEKPDEVLVRVRAAALNAGDVFMMQGSAWVTRLTVGFPQPRTRSLAGTWQEPSRRSA